MRRRLSATLVAVVLAAIATFVIADLAGGFGTFPNERWAAAVAMICLAVWLGPGLLTRYQQGGALKAAALWLAIACAIALLYVYGKDVLAGIGMRVP
jgi:hypothetical protein